MNNESNEDAIIRNLEDAGCDRETIVAFMEDIRSDREDEGMKLLAAHRRLILDEIHREQKKIDCLDYLVYKMEKAQKLKINV